MNCSILNKEVDADYCINYCSRHCTSMTKREQPV